MKPAEVARWLDTDEGQEWSLPAHPPDGRRSGSRTAYVQPIQALPVLGPLDPAHDPCGRGPLPGGVT